MSQLWTDIITPAELTGYARASLVEYEKNKGTLARWLPNRLVPDIQVRFRKGSSGLIPVASFRAYDAEPSVGKRRPAGRTILELPALGQTLPVSEYEQLRGRSGQTPSDEQIRSFILDTTEAVVQSVADAMELLRGIVLVTGKATVDQGDEFQVDDDFGRSAGHTLTAGSLWSSSSVSRLEYLQTIVDVYTAANGEAPGAIVGSNRVFRALAQGDELQTALVGGGSRPASESQVQDTLSGAGFPPFIKFDRLVSVDDVTTRVIPNDRLLLLPAPVEPDAWQGTKLGATFWGRTLSSLEEGWDIETSDQPGLVTGVYRNPKPPMGIEVLSDAIGEPVLANADLSLVAKVL